jgi:hypothetical protein
MLVALPKKGAAKKGAGYNYANHKRKKGAGYN